jgi:hypothetical protein
MRERPMLFSGAMVRAILDGRKTQTRRIVRLPCPRGVLSKGGWRRWDPERPEDRKSMAFGSWVYGRPGDRLWVRETWALVRGGGYNSFVGDYEDVDFHETKVPAEAKPRGYSTAWRADGGWEELSRADGAFWRPSIHMPRWACRLVLEVTDVRVQRLQEISEEDAKAEGVEVVPDEPFEWNHMRQFQALWDDINGKRAAWASNPWTWVVSFRKAEVG